MKEIERIWNEVVNIGDSNSPYDEEIAKAIEQYVIKARIEGAETALDIVLKRNFTRAKEYVAELKKGLE